MMGGSLRRLIVSADFAQFTTFHQITFNMFQRNVFGFRYQPQCQQDKQYVQSSIFDTQFVVVEQVMPKSRPFSG